MKIGMFIQPMMLPERTVKQTHEWGIQSAAWADQYGFADVYVGEHHTVKMEPIPCPDILVTEILRATKDIRVGTAGFVLPFHHPAQLANRVAYLDHISEGRFNFGIASGSVPTDWGMFDIDGFSGQQREMTQESLSLIRKLWAAETPEKFEGKYWTVAWPEPFSDALKPWLKPFQKPHPPISIAGATPGSSTLEFAGELGLNPMSIFLSQKLVETHWASYEKGCAKSGHAADRSKWIITREMIIADTDEQAWEIAKAGPAMRVYREYRLPMYSKVGWINNLKHNPQVPDEDVTIEYCLEHHWLIGSPETVAKQIEAMYHGVGGFGELMCLNQDFIDNPEAWRRTLELFGREVLPRIADLNPSADTTGAVAA